MQTTPKLNLKQAKQEFFSVKKTLEKFKNDKEIHDAIKSYYDKNIVIEEVKSKPQFASATIYYYWRGFEVLREFITTGIGISN